MKHLPLIACALLIATPVLAVDELAPPPPVIPQQAVASPSDIGRYQLFESQFSIGTLKGPENAEKNLLKIDTATGEVWIGKQTQYMDKKTGKLIQQRYWEPFEHYLEAQPFNPPPVR
ncbi:MAG TPA: hypothetical protein VLL73_06655 [Desulfurivibrionaceae bacterium]|nr:hypothetical protein [Desulfurivibrionaceae bacterium]